MKQKTRKPNPVTRLHTRVSKNKCPHESFQCGLTHSWIIKLASRVGSPTLYSDCIIMQEFLRLVACARGSRVRGHVLYEPSEANAAFCAKCECEALFFSSPRFAQNATFASLSLGLRSALEEKRKKNRRAKRVFFGLFCPLEPGPRLASLGS